MLIINSFLKWQFARMCLRVNFPHYSLYLTTALLRCNSHGINSFSSFCWPPWALRWEESRLPSAEMVVNVWSLICKPRSLSRTRGPSGTPEATCCCHGNVTLLSAPLAPPWNLLYILYTLLAVSSVPLLSPRFRHVQGSALLSLIHIH